MNPATGTERDLTTNEQMIVRGNCQHALAYLGLEQHTPNQRKVGAINDHVQAWQYKRRDRFGKLFSSNKQRTPLSEWFGCLWGKAFYDELGWGWFVLVDDRTDQLAIGDSHRSMVMFPIDFVHHCLKHEWADCTVELAFNMLTEGMTPNDLRAGSYENIMDRIAHIVPP